MTWWYVSHPVSNDKVQIAEKYDMKIFGLLGALGIPQWAPGLELAGQQGSNIDPGWMSVCCNSTLLIIRCILQVLIMTWLSNQPLKFTLMFGYLHSSGLF
jgi:hypothetical protein